MQDRAGVWKVLDVQVHPFCDLYVSHKPLAVLERGGARCWLTQRLYEDGVDYALTKSGQLSFDEDPSNCDFK